MSSFSKMTPRKAKRISKKSDLMSGKESTSKTQQIAQFWAKQDTSMRSSKSPNAKRSRSSTNSTAARLIKRMAENKKELSTDFQLAEDEREMENIPESLDDLNIAANEDGHGRTEGVQTVHELDELLDSDASKRILADSEVTIRFCCPSLANVGTVGHLFCIDDLSMLKNLLANNSSARFSPFVLLFLCRPHSRLRCALFDRFRQKAVAAGGAIAVPFSAFVFAICYAFQISPVSLQFTDDLTTDDKQTDLFEEKLNKIARHFAPTKFQNDKRRHRFRFANIELLFHVWHYLHFDHWTDAQIVALCRAIARLYLDIGAREFRSQLGRAFQMIFLHFPSSVRLCSVLSHFLTFSFLSSADHCVHSAFVVFQMFSQLDQFDQSLRLLAIQSVLNAIISKNGTDEKATKPNSPSSSSSTTKIHLGDALEYLPEAVSVVRRHFSTENEHSQATSSSLTVLYLLCNRWLDTLTADERLLIDRGESEASLEKALQSIRHTNEQLNRRNINDKMIHTWAQSEHRIRAALLLRRRGQLRTDQVGNARGKDNNRSSKNHTFVGSSSEDDDADE